MKTKKRTVSPRSRLIPEAIRSRAGGSLRIQLILTFIACLTLALLATMISLMMFQRWGAAAEVDYSEGMGRIDNGAAMLAYDLSLSDQPAVQEQKARERMKNNEPAQTYIVDQNGAVLLKSGSAALSRLDVHDAIGQAMAFKRYNNVYVGAKPEPFTAFYPVVYQGVKAYVVASGVPEGTVVYRNPHRFLPVMIGIIAFIGTFYYLTRRKIKYIEELAYGLVEISNGDLDCRVRVQGKSGDELASLADHINLMADKLQRRIEEERRIEKTKNELITNVSHDLRTPLTSIMGYLKLIMDNPPEDEETLKSYQKVAYVKSEKLKALIDSLFEYTKLAGEEEQLDKTEVNMTELAAQVLEEYAPLGEENEVSLVKRLPEHAVRLLIDPDKMVRVLENLLTNAITYSSKPGIVCVRLEERPGRALLAVENTGEPIPEEELERLFERMYRTDSSRSEETGGSGLGLAIAKSIVELHGGRIWAECEGEIIRFVIELPLEA
ncbi:HAMP domain-containing histidine kinase [Paenibacillus doosanensis]|uniref:sensor histidine kinase n=1 Tax=Paenibacillus doosanensis TaxID=1229154 RepID=UPI0021803350|nr:HAMP domain-containing sensor histidine kinase [Paenibacillus doosanensis]MCS7464110.1 HAMP domain-containing histidine kinase [Paenibacillus doosanensis]